MNIKITCIIAFVVAFAPLTFLNAQEGIGITGMVTSSEDGEALPGVTVLKKGTSSGTVTDLDGNFSIKASPEDILVFSFLGFQTQEIVVNGKTIVDVSLSLDIESLEEVVVVGYGEQKKANLTGAVLTVSTKDLDEIPTGNLAQGLIGKMAGVQVDRSGTGVPGTDTPLLIRDEDGSGLQRQLLYVIDGVVYSSNDRHDVPGPSGSEIFNRLDPSEIESISILKDGSAAVYGARGAGGVVLVTTKKGQPGRLKFTYNGSFGVGQPTQLPEMLTGRQHAELWNEMVRISRDTSLAVQGTPIRSSTFDNDDLELISQRDYDWLEDLYKDAYNQRHSFTMSGGSQNVRYFLSGGYYKETGNYDKLWYKRYSVRSNLEYGSDKDFQVGVGINYSQGQRKNPNYAGESQQGKLTDWYKRPLTAPRWVPPTVDGNPVFFGGWSPVGLLESNNYQSSASDNINLSMRLNYDLPFIKGLKFNGLLSYNINTETGITFGQNYTTFKYFDEEKGLTERDPVLEELLSNDESLRESFSKSHLYQFSFGTNYSRSFGKHSINVTLVYEQQAGETRGFNATKNDADIAGFDYFWAFRNDGIIGYAYNNSGRWSTIGRFNYDYNGKYLLESSYRAESSNRFHPDERFGFFPSVSVGWVLSEENLVEDNLSFMSFWKVRSSFGITGNDGNSPASEWRPTFNAGGTGAIFGRGKGELSNTVEAKNDGFYVPSRTWAKSNAFNFGMDLSFFDRKIDLTADYYYVLLVDAFDRRRDYPFILGNEKPPFENYKKSYSKGLEFQLGYKNELGKYSSYEVFANFSSRDSRPIRLYQSEANVGSYKDDTRNPEGNQAGLVALGIIRDEEHLEEVKQMYPGNMDAAGNVVINGTRLAPGMLYYKDVGGANLSRVPDGRIDGNDEAIIAKYTSAPYSYGFGLSYSYKGWKVNANFGGAFGHKVFINKDEQVVDVDSKRVVTPYANTFAWWADYWTEENKDAKLPRPYAYGYEGEISTFWMRDGHTLRLNNVSLSYTMSETLSKRLLVSRIKVYASATNVWTIISPFDFKDPSVSRAFDYPLVRMVNLGLSLSI